MAFSVGHQSLPQNQKHHPEGKWAKVGHRGPHQSPSIRLLDGVVVPNNTCLTCLECRLNSSANRLLQLEEAITPP